jgi:hypothetical protein
MTHDTQTKTETLDHVRDDRDDRGRRDLGLSPAQVLGSALAAVSGAFSASWLGTTGTLIGAAVGSVIATVGAAIYTHSLRRTGQAVKRTAVQVRHGALLTGPILRPDPGTAQDAPVRDPNAPGSGASVTEPATGAHTPDERRTPAAGLFPWVKVALASLAVLVAALGGITAVEAVTGRPIASLLGQDDGTGTTVGHVVGTDTSHHGTRQPTKDRPTQPTQPTPSQEPSQTPSQQPQEPAPSTPSTPSPTDTPVPPAQSQAPAPDGSQP